MRFLGKVGSSGSAYAIPAVRPPFVCACFVLAQRPLICTRIQATNHFLYNFTNSIYKYRIKIINLYLAKQLCICYCVEFEFLVYEKREYKTLLSSFVRREGIRPFYLLLLRDRCLRKRELEGESLLLEQVCVWIFGWLWMIVDSCG